MTVCSLDHFNIRASRELLEQLREFYGEVIGLSQGKRPPFAEFGYWFYAGEQAVVHLSLAGDDEDCAPGAATTLNHVAFGCTDRSAVERRLSDSGVEYKTERVPETNLVQLFLHDPAGNGIELSFGDEKA